MRIALIVTALLLVAAIPTSAQPPAAFEDVPPWHWAAGAVQTVAAAGILIGYPPSDRDQALNALTQVYDAFAHAAHPAAREWAERFLTNLPADWPQPLLRSRLVRFRLEEVRVAVDAGRMVVSAVAIAVLRANGGLQAKRSVLRADLQRDGAGRLRLNYATLAAAQPEVFR